jgi:hypothetical protein
MLIDGKRERVRLWDASSWFFVCCRLGFFCLGLPKHDL